MPGSSKNCRGILHVDGQKIGTICYEYKSASTATVDGDDELRYEETGTVTMFLYRSMTLPAKIEDLNTLRTYTVTGFSHDYTKRQTTLITTCVSK